MFPIAGEFSASMILKSLGKTGYIVRNPIEENIPQRPPVMCAGCPHRGMFYVLKKLKLSVMGDIGCYTLGALAPMESIDACVCMGASIGTVSYTHLTLP